MNLYLYSAYRRANAWFLCTDEVAGIDQPFISYNSHLI